MIARRFFRFLGALALAAGLAGGSAQAAPVLSSLVADNGVIAGPNAYSLQHATHTIGVAFTDSYRFSLANDWKVSELSSYINLGGGIQNFAVRLFSISLNQETLIASDTTPTVINGASRYDFVVPLAAAGDYRLEFTGTRIGFDYTGTLTPPPVSTVPEPGGVALLTVALLALGVARRQTARRVRA